MGRDNPRLVIYGAGGHAKVVCDAAQKAGYQVVGFLDDHPEKHGHRWFGLPILGGREVLVKGFPRDVYVVVGIGDNRARKQVASWVAEQGFTFATVVHPQAYIGPGVHLGPGTVVFAGVVVNADTYIGAHVILNTASSVDHDGHVGDFVHIAPGAHLGGHVTVGQGTLVGIGATVLPGKRLGAWSIVGGGAVVYRDIPDHTTVVGVPARPLSPPSA